MANASDLLQILAAHRYGIKRVILPERNLKDLVEVPSGVLASLEVRFNIHAIICIGMGLITMLVSLLELSIQCFLLVFFLLDNISQADGRRTGAGF